MAHPTDKQWKPPKVRSFDTPEEMLAHYEPKATPAEREKIHKLFEQMRDARRGRANVAASSQEEPRMTGIGSATHRELLKSTR